MHQSKGDGAVGIMTVVPPARAPAARLQPLLNREFNNGGSDAAQAALQLSRMMQRSMCARTHCKHTPTPTQTHTRIHGRARPHTSARALTQKHNLAIARPRPLRRLAVAAAHAAAEAEEES